MYKFFIILVLSACAVGRDYKRPEISLPEQFDETSLNKTKVNNLNWWKSFNDPILEELVNLAVNNNLDLEMAKTRVLASRAKTWELIFDLLPSIGLSGEYTKSQASQARFPFIPDKESRIFEYYSTDADVSWEIDLFGRSRRGIEASNAIESIRAATLEDVLLSVVSETAKNYFAFRANQLKLNLQKKVIYDFEKILEMAKKELEVGRISKKEYALIENRYFNLRNQALALDLSVKTYKANLDNFVNHLPDDLNNKLNELKEFSLYSGAVTIGNPSDLLERRPDVIAAEANLKAVNANYGVAIGNLFPKISFTGSLGYEALKVDDLVRNDNKAYNIMPGISWIGTDILEVIADIKSADQDYLEALAQYKQTILKSLNEVQTLLADYSISVEQYQLSTKYSHNLGDILSATNEEYKLGATSCKSNLEQALVYYSARQQVAEAKLNLNLKLITLFKALGGGWFEPAKSDK